MAEFPALPLWTDAYLADTRHLTTEEHGAYLLLIMEAWRRVNCNLPDDDAVLARLAGLTNVRWAEIKPTIMAFWHRNNRSKTWSQKRLSRERVYVVAKSTKNRHAAATRWKYDKKIDASAMPKACLNDAPTPTPTEEKKEGGGGYAREVDFLPEIAEAAPTFREQILDAIGVDPSGLTGRGGTRIGTPSDMFVAIRWVDNLRLTHEEILLEIRRIMAMKVDGVPSSFNFFNQPMQRLAGAKHAPALQPIAPRGGPQNDRQRIGLATLETAKRLSEGTVHIDFGSRNPFAT